MADGTKEEAGLLGVTGPGRLQPLVPRPLGERCWAVLLEPICRSRRPATGEWSNEHPTHTEDLTERGKEQGLHHC